MKQGWREEYLLDGKMEKKEIKQKENLDETAEKIIGAAPDKEEPRRFCRKCLTREMDQTEYFQNLHEYIAHLDTDLKVDDTVYEARLAHCKMCDELYQGMCRICGCYVELRAAMKKNRCPQVHPRWDRVKNDE